MRSGAVIRTNAAVERVLVEGERANGVVLKTGETIKSTRRRGKRRPEASVPRVQTLPWGGTELTLLDPSGNRLTFVQRAEGSG